MGKANTLTFKQRGFTIVELLIVIVVIGILAAITIVAFNGVQKQARDTERISEVKAMQKAIEMYRVEKGEYPLHTGGVENAGYGMALIESLLVPEYIAALPREPNSTQPYQYVRDKAKDSYAIRVMYESKPQCHSGTNNTPNWWATPAC